MYICLYVPFLDEWTNLEHLCISTAWGHCECQHICGVYKYFRQIPQSYTFDSWAPSGTFVDVQCAHTTYFISQHKFLIFLVQLSSPWLSIKLSKKSTTNTAGLCMKQREYKWKSAKRFMWSQLRDSLWRRSHSGFFKLIIDDFLDSYCLLV